MKRTMFIGAIACGKTTLTQRLENQQIKYNKTQAVEFSANINVNIFTMYFIVVINNNLLTNGNILQIELQKAL